MSRLMAALVLTVAVVAVSTQDAWADGRRHGGPWHGGFHEHDMGLWRGGYWHNGWHEGRAGWWWVVGGMWYFYPAPVYPYPDPYRPPVVMAPAPPGPVWYYCANPAGYYPYVPQCFAPWQMVPATVQPAPPPAPMPPMGMAPPPMAVPPPTPSSGPGFDKATGGTVIGAAGGAVAGAQFGHGSGKIVATAVGTLLGAFVGHEVGTSLDRADVMAAQQAERNAYQAPVGQTITWNNPENGHSGTISPVRDGRDGSGNTCREFQQSVTVGGQVEHAYGTACRQPDGSWAVTN